MINVSNAFREKLEAGEPVRMVVDITFPDGTKKTINEDIMNGDNGFADCADSSSFPVGATICKTLTLSINNNQEQWKNYNFYGAKIHAYLKLQTSYAAPESVSTLLDESYNPILDSTGDPIIATQAATKDVIETIDKGVYTVTTPEQYSDIINVTALDDMYKANKAYTSGLKLPQSLINLVRDACKTVGIGMDLTMSHGDIIIRSIPDSMTFRQLFGYAAMVESANARIDYSSNLQFVKWDFEKTDAPELKDYGNPPTLSSDDIVITGIKVTNGQSNDDTDTDYSGMYGEDGYVLELENELIDTDQLQTVANIIGEQIVGARFRNLEGDLVYNPLIEFGDMVHTYDRLGNKYLTPLTDVSGNVGGLTTVKTQADDPIRGSSDFYGNSTKAIVAARQMVRKETSAREEAIQRLAETLSSSSGLYMTQESQQDGSIIYYMHNKSTIAESNIIWKLTAEAFAVSIDGGKTYPYGFAVTGELITRLLYAEGINADYIDAGTLIVRDKSGDVIFEADMDTGSVTIDGSCVTIGGKALSEKLDDVENAVSLARNMTMQLDNDYQGIPVDSDGNYTEFPECTTTATVMYGTQDITDNCTYTITTSQNVQGSWNKETKTYTVTGLTADSGWVNIKAAYLNNLVVSKQFSLAKQYAGPQGIPGAVGTDGKTTYLHIRYAPVQNPTAAQMSKTPDKYIGTYTDFSGVDSTDPGKYTWAKFEGDQGAQGPKGADGKSSYTWMKYATRPDGLDMSDNPDYVPLLDSAGSPILDSAGEQIYTVTQAIYIGIATNKDTATESTNPADYAWSRFRGVDGRDGSDGLPGIPGEDGRTPYVHFAYANSEDGKVDFSVDDSTDKIYIGQYTDYTVPDSTDPTKYAWTKIKGEQGAAGRTYFFQSNADVLLMGADKKITPSPLIVDSFYRDGNGEIAQSQKGWWKLEKSSDNGATWSALTVSQTAALDRLNISVNNLSLKAHDMLKVSLYFDQSKTKLADYQTFSVAVDVASLTQEQIVDILSDDGKFKGLYYEKDESGNTTLFISFNAMKGGVISLGGANNGNGQLKIYDDDGNLISRLGYTGYVVHNKSTGKPMVSLNTAGLRLYTDYTDSENYNALVLGKYGLFAQKVQNKVIELWMEGDTSKKWDGYIIRYLKNKVRMNTNSLFTDGCELGANFSTDGNATVGGTLMFYDLENQAKTSGKVKRQPVASVSADGSRVAYLNANKNSNSQFAVAIRGQYGSTNSYTTWWFTADNQSDVRLKENFAKCSINALDAVLKMPVCSFDWKESGIHQPLGLVADEIEKIDTLLVSGGGYNEDGSINAKQIDRLLLTEYAIKAIQELSAKVDEQEKRIKELERRLNNGKI